MAAKAATDKSIIVTKIPEAIQVIRGAKQPPKKQVDVLCHCPQKCDTRVPKDVRQWFYTQFQSVDDRTRQNAWLQSQIEMRSVYKRLWSAEDKAGCGGKLQRRVSCKYRVPTNIPLRLFPTMCGKVKTVEVCMKAFMNVYGVTEKRIRLQRERMISELRRQTSDDVALELASLEALSPASIDAVDAFFLNQLWKPELVGPSVDGARASATTAVGLTPDENTLTEEQATTDDSCAGSTVDGHAGSTDDGCGGSTDNGRGRSTDSENPDDRKATTSEPDQQQTDA